LNLGLRKARGEYIARIDADDVATPDRLQRQVLHLDAHPEVGILGARIRFVDSAGRDRGLYREFVPPDAIHWRLALGNVVPHPTVVLRRDLIERLGGYDEELRFAQDYDLWTRAVAAGSAVAVLPDVLCNYLVSEAQISAKNRPAQTETAVAVLRRYCCWLVGDDVSSTSAEWLWCLVNGAPLPEGVDPDQPLSLLRSLADPVTASRGRYSPSKARILTGRVLATQARKRAHLRSSRSILTTAARIHPPTVGTAPFWLAAARVARRAAMANS
jgi:hypothetical protein